MKKAFIVSAEVRVRVIVDVPEGDSGDEAAIEAAQGDIIDAIMSDYRSLVEVEEDEECPYGSLPGEDDQSEPAPEPIPAPELAAIESRAGMLGRMRVTLESADAMTRLELASLLAGYTPPEGLTFRLGDDPDDRDVFITGDGVADPKRGGLMPFLDYSTGTLLAMLGRVEGYYKHKALQNK